MRVGSRAKQCSSGVTSAKPEGARPALYPPMYHRRGETKLRAIVAMWRRRSRRARMTGYASAVLHA